MPRPPLLVLGLLGALVLAGCARTLGTEDYASDQPTGHFSLGATERSAPDASAPPPLTLHRPEGDVDLEPWTYCYSNVCADGMPADDLPVTRSVDNVAFSFPLEGWDFSAEFTSMGDDRYCRRVRSTPVARQDDGTHAIPALGPAGSWDVTVSGYADEGGDLFTSFRWETSSDSTRPTPASGVLSFLGPPMDGGDLFASSPTLLLSGLPVEPPAIEAELVLPDAPGALAYPMTAVPDQCDRDGVVYLSAGNSPGEVDLPDLGEPPYRTEVHLTMDGASYLGVGSWPDDLQPPTSNQMELDWTPPLPESVD